MKFKLIVFGCLFFIKNDIFVTTNSLPRDFKDTTGTTLEQYPLMALTGAFGWCLAVLITRQHLLTPASCPYRGYTKRVYFEFEYLPPKTDIPFGKNTQNYTISRIITDIHEPEGSGAAVLELEQPVTFSDTIRPAKLISKEEFDLFEINATAQVNGWYKDISSSEPQTEYKKTGVQTVELLDRSTCHSMFRGSRFGLSEDEKLCATTSTNKYKPLFGGIMSFQNKVAGLMIRNYCELSQSSASECIMTFLDVVPYLKWISGKVNVSVEELTGTVKKIEEIKQAKIEALEHEVLSKFESYKEAQTKFEKAKLEYHLELAQQTKLEFQTNNSIQEAKITKIETECIGKTEENVIKLLNGMQEKENERFNNLEEQVNNITEYLKSFTVRINKIVDYIAKVPPSN